MTARVLRLLDLRGHDAAAVCAREGLPFDAMANPDARIDYATSDRLVDTAVALVGADGFGASLADVRDDQTYDAAGLVLMTAPTFGEGLERAVAYQRLWGDGERFTVLRGVDAMTVRFRHPGASATAHAVLAELALLETFGAARALVDSSASARGVSFAHAPLGSTDTLRAIFGAEPVFGAAANELRLSRDLVERPMRVPQQLLSHAFDRQAQRALGALPAQVSFAARVRASCGDGPDGLTLGVADAARRLHVSPRTLQRRLSAENTSFAAVIDDLRRERVARLIDQGARMKEIAFMVGFADASALTRALARWEPR